MAAYFNEPDHTAHSYDSNTTQVRFTYLKIGEFIEAVLIRCILLLIVVNYSLVAICFGGHCMWLILFVMLNSCLQ